MVIGILARFQWKSDPDEGGRIASILGFQIPLGITAILMASGFSIMNAGLTRTPDPEFALAAFALGQTVTNMFGSPVWIARQMLLAYSTDRKSMKAALRVAAVVSALVMAWIAVLAYTPLGRIVYMDIFGASEALFPEVLSVVRICIFLPLVHFIRIWPQAILMRGRRTILMTWAMVLRLILMVIMALYLPGTGFLEGAALGACLWIAGMGSEGIFCIFFAWPHRMTVHGKEPASDATPATERDCVRFLLPMIAQGLLMTFSLPAVNAGLARTLSPERNLAVFQVSWSIAFMFLAFIFVNLSQTVLVLLRDARWWRSLKRVGIGLAALDSVALVLFVLSGASDWVLLNAIGVEAALIPATRTVLLLMAASPFLAGFVELHSGIALKRGQTPLVGIGKGLDLTVVLLVVFGLSHFFPGLEANVGPLGFAAGLTVNYIFLRRVIPEPRLEEAPRAE